MVAMVVLTKYRAISLVNCMPSFFVGKKGNCMSIITIGLLLFALLYRIAEEALK